MARRSDHSRDEIRTMAIDAAFAIVDESGYGGLSARKIAQQIGYTPGMLYLVFRNLDELVLELNARTLDEFHNTLHNAGRRANGPADAVRRFARSYIRSAFERRGRWSMIFQHRLPDGTPLPADFQARIDRLFELIEDRLAQLAPGREARASWLAARALWSGVHGICQLAVDGKLAATGSASAEAMADCLVTHFLDGYLKGV